MTELPKSASTRIAVNLMGRRYAIDITAKDLPPARVIEILKKEPRA